MIQRLPKGLKHFLTNACEKLEKGKKKGGRDDVPKIKTTKFILDIL